VWGWELQLYEFTDRLRRRRRWVKRKGRWRNETRERVKEKKDLVKGPSSRYSRSRSRVV